MATKLEGEALVATKKTTFFAASLTRRGLIFKLNIGSNYLSDSSLSFFVSFSLSEYVCTGRYPVQASVMFLKELIISLSLSIILSLSLCITNTLSLPLTPSLSLSLSPLLFSLSLSFFSPYVSLSFLCLSFSQCPFPCLCLSLCLYMCLSLMSLSVFL